VWASALLSLPRLRYKQGLYRLVMHTQSLNQLGGSCAAIESSYILTFARFLAWNPAVGSNCQSLELGFAYCVGISAAATTTTTSSAAAVTAPGPTQAGILANYNAWTLCRSGRIPRIVTKISYVKRFYFTEEVGLDYSLLMVGNLNLPAPRTSGGP
jgi:hypothetical protein